MQTTPQNTPEPNHEFTINIILSRRLAIVIIVALLALAAWALLAWGHSPAEASVPPAQAPAAVSSSTGMRKFYLTLANFNGSQPDEAGVCEAGYHFASIWEIMDPSNLEYDGAAYAKTGADGGEGPPTPYYGWVRTGYNNNTSVVAGQANCQGWVDPSDLSKGTLATLPQNWTDPATQDIHIWDVGFTACNSPFGAWCVED